MADFAPLIAPSLFPSTDWTPYIEQTQQNASGGQLTDFNPSSPVVALNEGFLWAMLECLAYADQLPQALAIAHLKNAGIMRILGAKATVTLTFQLTATLGYWQLQAGYQVATVGGQIFETDNDLFIYNGNTGIMTATAVEDGIAYNVPAFTINIATESRAYLQTVTNYQAAAGGLDAETDDAAIARGYSSLRSHGVLITEDDFAEFTKTILGDGAIVKIIGRLSGDKQTYAAGCVHIFALNPDGSTLNDAQALNIQEQMQNSIPAFLQASNIPSMGTGVYVSSLELYELEIEIVGTLIAGDSPNDRAAQIYTDLLQYLAPGQLAIGETVVLYNLMATAINSGLKDIQSLRAYHYDIVNNLELAQTFDSNIPLPNSWTAAVLSNLTMSLIDSTGQTHQYDYGNGGSKD